MKQPIIEAAIDHSKILLAYLSASPCPIDPVPLTSLAIVSAVAFVPLSLTGTTFFNGGNRDLVFSRACCAINASIITKLAIASTMGTARGTTHGSCRRCRNREHGVRKFCFEFVEAGFAEADGTVPDYAGDCAADGVVGVAEAFY